jgi:hypothetical protein
VCSPNDNLFQYQAGPLSSYFDITSMLTPAAARIDPLKALRRD